MAETPIYRALDELPTGGLTVRSLQLLDFVVPGGWKNITNFTEMIRDVTGEDDDAYIQEIGEHAVNLFNDPEESYQRAMKIFRLVDDIDKVAGAAALASQAAERFSFMSFLGKITPKDDTTQAIDAAAKIAAELTTFCLINGLPGDSVMDFVRSVTDYEQESAIRFGAWVTFDGLVPLGPDFMTMLANKIEGTGESTLQDNSLFSKVTKYLPGGSFSEKKGLVLETISNLTGTVGDLVASKGLTRENVVDKVRGFVDVSDDRLDLLAAGLDMSTNYFEHTGTQTIARQLISRAYGEV